MFYIQKCLAYQNIQNKVFVQKNIFYTKIFFVQKYICAHNFAKHIVYKTIYIYIYYTQKDVINYIYIFVNIYEYV